MSSQTNSPWRHRLITAFVVVLVALNIAIFVWKAWRSPSPLPMEQTERSRRKQEILLAWNSAPAVPIHALTGFSLQRSKPQIPCFDVPEEGRVIAFEDLSPEKQIDLEKAVVGLVKAIVGHSGQSVLDYMNSRRKVYDPDSAQVWRQTLVDKYKHSQDAVKKMSDNEVFLAARSIMENSSHWTGLVADESCYRLWTTRSIPASRLRDSSSLSKALFEVFLEMRSWRHHFVADGEMDLEEVLNRGDEVLVADVRLLIEHDAEYLQQRAPYLVRFWYHPDHQLWQPIALVRVGTFDDAPDSLTF